MNGAERIAAERKRQVEAEGWDATHDQFHLHCELNMAAQCYLFYAEQVCRGNPVEHLPAWWPWNLEWWKPSPDPIRTLEKAGALVAAEIDRLLALKDKS